jgi:tryptophan synthase beta subunit
MRRDQVVLVNLSGRGDKDVISVQKALQGGNGRG